VGTTDVPRRQEDLRRLLRNRQAALGPHFKPDSDERAALLADERFYSPPYFGPSGWLALDLEARPVDGDEVRELVDASYRQVALKRMLRALDA
jgi:predicted DNA-binding protein (MmcQ/YjbR family)